MPTDLRLRGAGWNSLGAVFASLGAGLVAVLTRVPESRACGDSRGVGRFVVVTGEREGDELSTLVEREAPGLRRLAYARTGSWPAAEDVVQDVLADAHRRWDTVAAYDDPMAWARRAVLNRAASWHRRRFRERRALGRLAGRAAPESVVVDEPRLDDEELWSAIRSLSDRQAEVVLLLWFEDLPAGQVAEILGCGEDTVRTHWRRARVHLAKALGEHDYGGEDGEQEDER